MTWAEWTAVIVEDDRITARNGALCDGPGQHAGLALVVYAGVYVAEPLSAAPVQLTTIHAACMRNEHTTDIHYRLIH